MFDRHMAVFCMAALFGFAGCSTHYPGAQPSIQRPLWSEIPAYEAGTKPDTVTPPRAAIEEPAGELELRDALALSLLHNPRLAGVAWSVRIGEARVVQAGLRPNPELEVEMEEFGGTGPRREFSGAETTIRLSQLIEFGDKRGARLRAAGAGKTLAEYDYEAERLTVLTDAAIRFIDVLTAQDRLKLADELLDISQQTFETVAERVRAGKVSPLEETKASIERVNRRIARTNAATDLRIARERLASMWGVNKALFREAAGSLDVLEDIPSYDALETLIDRNPGIARWAGEMEQRLAELSMARAQRMFDITLSAGVKRFEESDDYAFTVSAGIPLPVFDRNQGGAREASYRMKQAEHRETDARIQIRTALLEWYETMAGARVEALALRDEVVPAARLAIDAARSGYRQGKFGYLEVLDAERTFAETNLRLIEALGRYHRAVAAVESLIGIRLDTVTGESAEQMEERR
jgi:cobalt-zinc-cadmium efflux system outer membrane protein